MDLGLTGKVAVITGGSEGIGRGIALRFLEEGAKVAICARRDDVLQQAAEELRALTGGDVLAVPADVTKPETLTNFIDRAVQHFGRIDILVNNAGRSAASAFDDLDDDDWHADLDLKLMGAVRCVRLVIPQMKLVGGGRIINVTHPGGQTAWRSFLSNLCEPRSGNSDDQSAIQGTIALQYPRKHRVLDFYQERTGRTRLESGRLPRHFRGVLD